ncbi:MAG: hypothetical protein WDN66_05045 [Candidatus Saccharibacteria bacterium]
MSKEFTLPAPKPIVDLSDEMFDRVWKLMWPLSMNIYAANNSSLVREDFLNGEKLNWYRGRKLLKLTSPLVELGAKVLGGDIVELSVDTQDVAPNSAQRSPQWHWDGAARSVVASNALTTNFVTGTIDETHPIAAMFHGTPKGHQLPNDFSNSVDQAIDKGELELYQTDPGTAYAFTYEHVHCGQINQTDEVIRRCFMRVVNGTVNYYL